MLLVSDKTTISLLTKPFASRLTTAYKSAIRKRRFTLFNEFKTESTARKPFLFNGR